MKLNKEIKREERVFEAIIYVCLIGLIISIFNIVLGFSFILLCLISLFMIIFSEDV